ncbi:MAG: hypothetical protein FJY95_17495 [Candidatus Handelsmanbacteria bacterium]|nr:hypothetical protein [Candidatus Handelsmanbacteria bacterium]
MKTTLSTFALSALLWSWAASAQADQPAPAPPAAQLMEGKLVDLVCYAMDMGGVKHAKCGALCAEKGQPVGFIDRKTAKLYTVLLPSPGLAKYLEQPVRLTGKVQKEALVSPEKLELKEGENWTAVALPKAM